jgi:hypothetical protein
MNEQLVKFIELCLIDGVITDKEREVIFRKSKKLGIPEDECEIILEGMILQYKKNSPSSETTIETPPSRPYEDENKKTLNIVFKKSISKPLVIDTLNFLCDYRNKNEVNLNSTLQHYEKLLDRDKEIYPIQEFLIQEKQERESKVSDILKKRAILNGKTHRNQKGERELEEKKREFLENGEPLFEEAAEIIFENQQGSTSLLQRKLNIGYNRAGRIIDNLEMAGIVGPFLDSKQREIIPKNKETLNELLNIFYEQEN